MKSIAFDFGSRLKVCLSTRRVISEGGIWMEEGSGCDGGGVLWNRVVPIWMNVLRRSIVEVGERRSKYLVFVS